MKQLGISTKQSRSGSHQVLRFDALEFFLLTYVYLVMYLSVSRSAGQGFLVSDCPDTPVAQRKDLRFESVPFSWLTLGEVS